MSSSIGVGFVETNAGYVAVGIRAEPDELSPESAVAGMLVSGHIVKSAEEETVPVVV